MTPAAGAEPYVPRLAVEWLRHRPGATWQEVDGSLAFVDISGFTALTERLAAKGRIGAEQLSDILSALFSELLAVAYRDGAGLVKWGGDALVLLFEGPDHATRAVHATVAMRQRLAEVGTVGSGAARVTLRMSAGIHSGRFHCFLVGDPTKHRELVVCGPAASRCVEMQAAARADEIGITAATANLIPPDCVGAALGAGFVVAEAPAVNDDALVPRPDSTGLDIEGLLPQGIRERVCTVWGEAEHRRIAVAFVQFSGTDMLLTSQGPEALADALDACVRAAQQSAQRYGVTFFETDVGVDGGKVMLTAGAPTTGARDAERLLLAVTDVVRTHTPLALRAGVNAGDVFAGDFGAPFRRTYSVKGDAVNLAARLLGRADVGEVVATLEVLDSSDVRFDTVTLEPFHVKGKSAVVHATKVGARRGGTSTIDIPFVGRAAEVGRVRAAIDAAVAGAGAAFDVSGDAGSGTSRLAAVVISSAGVPAHVARCDEYERSTPFWAFRQVLRSALGVAADADDGAVDAAVRSATALVPHMEPWLPLVGDVLGIDLPASPQTAALGAGFRHSKLAELTVELLGALVPTTALLVFDDAQHLDPASADLVRELMNVVDRRPWVVMVARRSAANQPEFPAEPLPLGPLADHEAQALVEAVMAGSPITAGEVAALVTRGSGNPLFLRSLAEAARAGHRVEALPHTLQGAVASRIDRLSAADRSLLRVASVLGTTFDESDLRTVLGDRGTHADAAAFHRLAPFLRLDSGRCSFHERVVRDTAYDGLPYRLRRQLHGIAGDAMEARSGDDPDATGTLSLHFLAAGRWDAAWRHAQLGAQRAAAMHAHGEAEVLYERADAAARHLRTIEPAERCRMLLALAEAQKLRGRPDAALATLRRLRRVAAGDAVVAGEGLRREASIQVHAGNQRAAQRTVARGLARLTDIGTPAAAAVRADLLTTAAWSAYYDGRASRALTLADDAERAAHASGDASTVADATETAFIIGLQLGRPDRAKGLAALSLFQRIGDRVHQGVAVANLALLEWNEGNGDAALDMFRQAEQLARTVGDTSTEGISAYNAADVLVLMGRGVEAEAELRRVIAHLTAIGRDSFVALARRSLALALLAQGRVDEARALLDAVLAEQRANADDVEEAGTLCALAQADLAAGQPGRARDRCRTAEQLCVATGAEWVLPPVLRVLGAALVDLDATDAADVLMRAQAAADAHVQAERGFVLAERARLAQRAGATDESAALAEQSEQAFERLGFIGSERYPRS